VFLLINRTSDPLQLLHNLFIFAFDLTEFSSPFDCSYLFVDVVRRDKTMVGKLDVQNLKAVNMLFLLLLSVCRSVEAGTSSECNDCLI
jgi:hypothetical protein